MNGLPRSYTAEWNAKHHVHGGVDYVGDPLSSSLRQQLEIGRSSIRLSIGRVIDCIAYNNVYIVKFGNGNLRRLCTTLSQGSFSSFGMRSARTMVVGDWVLVMTVAGLADGYILSVLPLPVLDASCGNSDCFHQASRPSISVDDVHKSLFKLPNSGGISDYSDGRPFDQITLGESGWIASSGVRVLCDMFHAQIGVDEATGLSVHYLDQLSRLAGVNLQIHSHAHEFESLIDEDELLVYQGYALYPWEAIGKLQPSNQSARELEDEDSQIDKPYYSVFEPPDDKMQAFHRLVTYGGYLGGVQKTMVQAPPDGLSLYLYGDVQDVTGDSEPNAAVMPVGLSSDTMLPTGARLIESSHSISIIKRLGLPAYKRRRRPEDPGGDTAGNYDFSGIDAIGNPKHKVKADNQSSHDPSPHAQQAAGIFDIHAQLFNWQAMQAVVEHTKDWYAMESKDCLGGKSEAISFSALRGSHYLRRPDAIMQSVDVRYGEVEYFSNTSYLSFLNDGSIVMSDGYGAEIRSCGGHWYICGPGDINFQSGRSINLMAGNDVNIRAKDSVDISATDHDMRLYCGGNMQNLAAGGVLIQSKGEGDLTYGSDFGEDLTTSGIILKSENGGPLVCMGGDVYLRAGGGDLDGGGEIVLDANQGAGDVVVDCNTFARYIKTQAIDYLGVEDGEASSVNSYKANETRIGSKLSVNSTIVSAGNIASGANLLAAQGHIYTSEAAANKFEVGQADDRSVTSTLKTIGDNDDLQDDDSSTGADAHKEIFDGSWRAPADGPGSDDFMPKIQFSFRTTEQYVTADFEMFESRWQQMARLDNAGEKWSEVKLEDVDAAVSRPYPGNSAMDEENFMLQDLNFYDADEHCVKDRKTARATYEEPKFVKPTGVKLEDGYLVTN